MDLLKNKYKKSEVEEIIEEVKCNCEDRIRELKDYNEELSGENRKLFSELDEYKNKDALINSALVRAEEKSREITDAAKAKYALEVNGLKVFAVRFKEYFEKVIVEYPLSSSVKKAKEIFDETSATVSDGKLSEKEKITAIESALDGKKSDIRTPPFNPQSKINEYIAATGDNGFNLDEVLNPGELDLGDLCEELGLTEQKR